MINAASLGPNLIDRSHPGWETFNHQIAAELGEDAWVELTDPGKYSWLALQKVLAGKVPIGGMAISTRDLEIGGLVIPAGDAVRNFLSDRDTKKVAGQYPYGEIGPMALMNTVNTDLITVKQVEKGKVDAYGIWVPQEALDDPELHETLVKLTSK